MQHSSSTHIEEVKQFLRQMGATPPATVQEARERQAASIAMLPRMDGAAVRPVTAAGM